MNRAMSMNRPQSLASDQDMNDGMGKSNELKKMMVAEIELQKLQRQYRIMEGDRKAYSEESRLMISKQRATIEKLKKDNAGLMDELRLLEVRSDDEKRASIEQKKVQELNEQGELYQWKIKQLQPEIGELEQAIHMLSRDIDKKRAELGGVNAASENNGAIEKQIKVLENRLDKALVKFNRSLAGNKKLRATIDNLRRERLVFDNIYRKFEKELLEQKKAMADIIEASNAAYEARDEAQAKIIAWREKMEKETQAYMQEIKDLDRSYEQDRKLKEFMATKAADRFEKNPEAAEAAALKKKSHGKKKQKDGLGQKFPSQESITESLEFYEKAFADIQRVTGTSNIEGLVQRFKAMEDTNFSLFNYVNEINNEIENLHEEIVEKERKISAIKVENVAIEEEQKKVMADLESSLNSCNEKSLFYERQYNDTVYNCSEIRKAVEKIVKLLQHMPLSSGSNSRQTASQATHPSEESENGEEESSPLQESSFIPSNSLQLALGATAVTDANLLQFLGVIEHKANELMTLNYLFTSPRKIGSAGSQPQNPNPALEESKGETPVASEVAAVAPKKEGGLMMPLLGTVGALLGQGPTAPIGNIQIVAPTVGDDHDSEDNNSDEDDRPLTRDELKQKTLRGLSKRERNATHSGPSNAKKTLKNKRKIGKSE